MFVWVEEWGSGWKARRVFAAGQPSHFKLSWRQTTELLSSHKIPSSSSLTAEYKLYWTKWTGSISENTGVADTGVSKICLTASPALAFISWMEARLLAETLGTFFSLKSVLLAFCGQTEFNKVISDPSTCRNGLSLFLQQEMKENILRRKDEGQTMNKIRDKM